MTKQEEGPYNRGMASIRDVAKEAGVSPATVSRTFTTPGLINDETRNRVLAAARLLDYHPPRLRKGRRPVAETADFVPSRHPSRQASTDISDAIGFQFFHRSEEDSLLSNVFYAPVLAGAQAEASALGLHVLVHSTDHQSMKSSLPRMVTHGGVGGLLLVGVADAAILSQFARQVPAIVLVDNPNAVGPFESVLSDGFEGGYTAARHVLALGHKRLGFFLAEAETVTFRERLHGWLCAQFDAGLQPDPAFVVSGADDAARRAALLALLTRPDRPTALMSANDHFAVDTLRLCREIGLRVPEDISLIGFDDVRYSAATDPPLTTLRVDTVLMGRLAVRRLVVQMQVGVSGDTGRAGKAPADPACLMGVRHVVPVSLLARGTTAPPVVAGGG